MEHNVLEMVAFHLSVKITFDVVVRYIVLHFMILDSRLCGICARNQLQVVQSSKNVGDWSSFLVGSLTAGNSLPHHVKDEPSKDTLKF